MAANWPDCKSQAQGCARERDAIFVAVTGKRVSVLRLQHGKEFVVWRDGGGAVALALWQQHGDEFAAWLEQKEQAGSAGAGVAP
jgi:hypothetical protein